MNSKLQVRVIDRQTEQTLMSCPMEDANKAYAFAAEMEEMGLDVRVIIPTLSESLGESLGLSAQNKELYQESIAEEMDNHDGSCCFEDTDHTKH